MLLFTEFKVQCSRIVPDAVEWTDVQTAYRWRDTMSRRDPLFIVAHLREGVIDYYYDAGMPVPAVN